MEKLLTSYIDYMSGPIKQIKTTGNISLSKFNL